MSFQPDKAQLETGFQVLQQKASATIESWNDPVQRRFYEQFINSLPREFLAYINELDKLDHSFERAEQTIDELKQN